MPLVRGERAQIHDAIFAEVTYHAAYEPQRCDPHRALEVRQALRRLATGPVLANCDDGPSKALLIERGWRERRAGPEQLYELTFDPNEAHNRIDDPAAAAVTRRTARAPGRGCARPTIRS